MSEFMSLAEVAAKIGKSKRTVYRYVKEGKLEPVTLKANGNDTVKVSKSELERFLLCHSSDTNDTCHKGVTKNVRDVTIDSDNVANNVTTPMNTEEEENLTKEGIREIIEDVWRSRENQLMKPIEQQAIFIAGKLTEENKNLKEKIEMVMAENSQLREAMKMLPAPPEEMVKKMAEKEEELSRARVGMKELNAVKEEMERQAQEAENLWQQADNECKRLKRQVDILESSEQSVRREKAKLEEEASKIRQELEKAIGEKEEIKSQLEYARMPWWKKMWSKR